MPLTLGTSPKTRAKNLAKLINEGYKPQQATAIAYNVQRKAQGKKAADPAQMKPQRPKR